VTPVDNKRKSLSGESSWETFSSPKGGFAVSMPSPPVEKKQVVNTPIPQLDVYSFTVELKGNPAAHRGAVFYAVYYSDYPDTHVQQTEPEKILDAARDGGVASSRGHLISELIISLDGYPGRDIRIALPTIRAVMRFRIYLVRQRLYQLAVVTSKDEASSQDIGQFLDSFRLLGNQLH